MFYIIFIILCEQLKGSFSILENDINNEYIWFSMYFASNIHNINSNIFSDFRNIQQDWFGIFKSISNRKNNKLDIEYENKIRSQIVSKSLYDGLKNFKSFYNALETHEVELMRGIKDVKTILLSFANLIMRIIYFEFLKQQYYANRLLQISDEMSSITLIQNIRFKLDSVLSIPSTISKSLFYNFLRNEILSRDSNKQNQNDSLEILENIRVLFSSTESTINQLLLNCSHKVEILKKILIQETEEIYNNQVRITSFKEAMSHFSRSTLLGAFYRVLPSLIDYSLTTEVPNQSADIDTGSFIKIVDEVKDYLMRVIVTALLNKPESIQRDVINLLINKRARKVKNINERKKYIKTLKNKRNKDIITVLWNLIDDLEPTIMG